MNTLAHAGFADEQPTRKTERVAEPLLVFASRVDRLAELALERLQCAPDDESLEAAVADIQQLRALCSAVTT